MSIQEIYLNGDLDTLRKTLKENPALMWEERIFSTRFPLAALAALSGNIELLRIMYNILQSLPLDRITSDKLLKLTFEQGDVYDRHPVLLAAIKGHKACFDFLLDYCCPSGAKMIDRPAKLDYNIALLSIESGDEKCTERILRESSRGIESLRFNGKIVIEMSDDLMRKTRDLFSRWFTDSRGKLEAEGNLLKVFQDYEVEIIPINYSLTLINLVFTILREETVKIYQK